MNFIRPKFLLRFLVKLNYREFGGSDKRTERETDNLLLIAPLQGPGIKILT